MKNTIVINIIGGPGTGKTTVAAELFSKLKRLNLDVENVSEFSNELVWENNTSAFNDRLYMHAIQHHRLFTMKGKLDYIITDSPLLLTSVYNNFYLKDVLPESYNQMIDLAVKETWNLYDNITYYLKRDTSYNPVGRRENVDEAIQIDLKVKEYLDLHHIVYKEVNIDDAANIIYEDVLRLKNPSNL